MRKLITLLGFVLLFNDMQAQDTICNWSFDRLDAKAVYENIKKVRDPILGFFDPSPGVKGQSILFDGFTGYVMRKKFGSNLPPQFTLTAWVSLEAYPWFRCPVFDLRSEEKEGILLAIDANGKLTAGLGYPLNWTELTGPQIPHNKWTMVSLVVDPVEGVSLYMNDRLVNHMDHSPVLRNTGDYTLTLGRNAILEEWWDFQYTVTNQYSYLDGRMDEVCLRDGALTAAEIKKVYQQYLPLPEIASQVRILPSGPEGLSDFGASYTRLNYTKQWDRLWRVGDYPDVLVRFADQNCRLIFWRGTSMVPCWVTENGIWYTNEWTETWGSDVTSCAEPLMDRDCRFSHVRIIENTAARTIVHWRYGLVDSDYTFVAKDVDGRGEWTDEYYIIYPDGIGIRRIDLHYSNPLRKHDWEESIILLSPGQHPDQVMQDPEVTLVNMRGETHDYSWRNNLPIEMKEPAGANIHVVNLKSRFKPFYIVSPEPFESVEGKYDSPFFRTYSASLGTNWQPDSVPSIYGWWNHWPVTPVPGDGRWVVTNDRASHFNLTTFTQWKDYYMDERVKTRIMLHGMTDLKPEKLVPLANSWLHAPELELLKGEARYEPAERAWLVDGIGETGMEGKIRADQKHPSVKPAFVLKNMRLDQPVVVINGKTLLRGKDFQSGTIKEVSDWKTIIWLNADYYSTTSVTIK